MKKKTILDLYKMKKEGEKVSWITSYDAPFASFVEAAGIDMILVGDSLGMVVQGFDSTIPVTMDMCIDHCQAVRRGAPNTFIVGDMPFGSYQVSDEEAAANAIRFLKEGGVDAIKLEGGKSVASRIRAIRNCGIVVCGHIGLTPQSSGVLGGHKAQGRTVDSARAVLEDALAVQEAGANFILVEAVPPEVTAEIHKLLSIPVYSIGAGAPCDGQLTIFADTIGMFQAFTPKFIKKYAEIAPIIIDAFKQYSDEIKNGQFPTDDHVYHVIGDIEPFNELFAEFDAKYLNN
ncbi:MAG: 3-methyl-2-oxobutanoate hydroxymethyltransferase [Oscillospiraceae bacterium]|nr:3-methyl-2-oxobutanoate hydroxymethyltransferase [Oscillospiraceae bacterium]